MFSKKFTSFVAARGSLSWTSTSSPTLMMLPLQQRAAHFRSQNVMPRVSESYKSYKKCKETNEPAVLWWKILTRRRKNKLTSPKKENRAALRALDQKIEAFHRLPRSDQKQLKGVTRLHHFLRQLKGNSYGAFRASIYHAIRYDRPDLILYLRKAGCLGPEEEAFVARARLAMGQRDIAEKIAAKLRKEDVNGKFGVIGLLIALGEYKEARIRLDELRQKSHGQRAALYDLLNSPFEGELEHMLKFATLYNRGAVTKVLRLQAIRAYCLKHQPDRAFSLFKEHMEFFKNTHASESQEGYINVRTMLTIAKMQPFRTEVLKLKQLVEENKNEKQSTKSGKSPVQLQEEVVREAFNEMAAYVSHLKPLEFLSRYPAVYPLFVRIFEEASAGFQRQYFYALEEEVVKVFKSMNKLDELKGLLQKASKESTKNPEFIEFLNMVRYHMAIGEYETAFDLFMDAKKQKEMKHLTTTNQVSLKIIRNIQKRFVESPIREKAEPAFKFAKYLKYPTRGMRKREAREKELAEKREVARKAAEEKKALEEKKAEERRAEEEKKAERKRRFQEERKAEQERRRAAGAPVSLSEAENLFL